jgi:DNA-binding beta-propeller fold protein YncE
MTNSTRRSFLHAVAVTSSAFAIPRISMAQQSWRVSTVAGTGVAGYEEEGRGGIIATETPVNNPYGVVIGPGDDLYFCEVDTGRTRRLNLETNRLSTIAGNGEKGFITESRRPRETSFNAPHEIRWDEQGNLYIVERDSHSVRRIAAQSGLVTTLAGNGEPGDGGDGRSAVLSQLNRPHSIAFDSSGNLLICDIGNHRLRIVSRETGIISTLSGTGERAQTPDTGPLEGTPLLGPRSIDTDPDGNAYLVLREGNAIFQIDIAGNRLQRIAGTGEQGYIGDGGPAINCTFNGPKGIAYSRQDHSLYIVDTENHVIRRMSLATGLIDTVLGNGEQGDGPDGDPLNCMTNRPHGVCVHDGLVYVTDSESHRVRAISGLM